MENYLLSYWKDGNTCVAVTIGDPDGQPFRVWCHTQTHVLLDIVVYAIDEEDAKQRVLKGFDAAIKLEKESGYKSSLGTGYKEEKMTKLKELGMQAAPFDKRYCTKFPWASNDTIV